nr:caspase family protein [Massilia antarctica]
MTKGIAVAIGLNGVDPVHYQGWSGPLLACEADAIDMQAIGRASGFQANTLLTGRATRKAVTADILAAAKSLAAGDIFMISYSGHGGQLPDLNGDESDGLDETWCLFDGQMTDDELYALWAQFSPGVRILQFSDSCHSGTVNKAMLYAAWSHQRGLPSTPKAMPLDVASRVYLNNREFYDPILKSADVANAKKRVGASVLLISGCQDNQLSQDGPFNGAFTGALKTVWNGGKFVGDYARFKTAIANKLPPDQSPELSQVGRADLAFAAQKPFTIG